MSGDKAVYTVDEVAALLRVNPATVRRMAQDGRLPRIRLDVARVLIPAWAVEAILRGDAPDSSAADTPTRKEA